MATLLPCHTADDAGLIYVSDDQPGIRRAPAGKIFTFRAPGGSRLRDARQLGRIRRLAIPPAWTDVWICADPLGHIQATGRDARGRKQYRYHDRFREVRDAAKYDRMFEFASLLPVIRETVDRHLSLRGLPREKVLATVVRLLETTMIRVGNSDYARQNGSYGLTTLRDRHVEVDGSELRFRFKGKSGREWRLSTRDRRVARIVKAAQELPGQHLFQYLDEEGARREVTSGDVNLYLKEISGADITAKDFRTWAGTVLAAMALRGYEKVESEAAARRNLRAAIDCVATRLGNTPTVCRKCYVHPEILSSYLAGELLPETKAGPRGGVAGLTAEEALVLAFLRRRVEAAAKPRKRA